MITFINFRGEKMNNKDVVNLIKQIEPTTESINMLGNYLDYIVGNNPINNSTEWKIFFTHKLKDYSKGVIAVKTVPNLNKNSTTMDIRRLYKEVEELKDEFGMSFDVQIVGFIGKERLIFFPFLNGNRDMRLDINEETVEKTLYKDNFELLKDQHISIIEDEFGFGDSQIDMDLKQIFKRSLTSHFRQMTNFYRKKLSELIVSSSDLRIHLVSLIDNNAKFYLNNKDLVHLVQQNSFKNVLSVVTDTIMLRQLMRRFLEGYYGSSSFETTGIALGIGDGTMDDAIQRTVTATRKNSDERDIKNLNKKKTPIIDNVQLNLFDTEENKATADVEDMTEDVKESFNVLIKKARKQFETIYDGDLFAGSIGEVANKIEKQLSKHYPEFFAQMWVDTSSDRYSFRYEDLPPNAIEEHYENSMSQNVQINIEEGKPVIFYGSDELEQKSKGAYYTNNQLVEYMVKQTVEPEFNQRINQLKQAIQEDSEKIKNSIEHLLDMKIGDLTCGGGSFLRGAFLYLSNKHSALSSLNLNKNMLEQYPMFKATDDGEYLWEKYILNNMLYGVDYDYKAIIISSLTLTLSSLEHRKDDEELPKLVGRTLIHQNSLINAVPFYNREKIYLEYQNDIKRLRKAKISGDPTFEKLRQDIQTDIRSHNYDDIGKEAEFSHVEALEINLPEVFFNENGLLKDNPGFDCIIGNPPWEGWKPKEDEFYSQYDEDYPSSKTKRIKNKHIAKMKKSIPNLEEKWAEYVNRFKVGSAYFQSNDNFRYLTWRINGKKTGGDLNLYIISIERFNQLLKRGSYFSLLVDNGFITADGSTGVRNLLFGNYNVKEFLSFENRQKIFSTVDSRYKFAVLTYKKESGKNQNSFNAFFYRQNLNDLNNGDLKIKYPISLLKESENYSAFEIRNDFELSVTVKMKKKFPSIKDTYYFKLKNDFHKTNDSEYFKDYSSNLIPLYEGKYINQFKVIDNVADGVSVDSAETKTNGEYKNYRIAIRAIGSSTNRRSLIATLLPKNSVAANSLHVQTNLENVDLKSQLFYLGILNSYIIDFFLRKLISTNINKLQLKQLPFPKYGELSFTEEIVEIVELLLKFNEKHYDDIEIFESSTFHSLNFNELVAELNARVFIDFGINREEIIEILQSFESAKHKKAVREEAQRIINAYDQLM